MCSDIRRRAILIMAYMDFDQLADVMGRLDFEGFDMYVHVDTKVDGAPFGDLAASCSRFLVGFVDRTDVSCDDFS